jgi:predicted nucleic acid-binding protein
MRYVINSTPLIYLSKVSLSWIFRELGEVIIPPKVYEEVVVRGRERGEGDALIVEELINGGVLSVEEIEPAGVFRGLEKELHEAEIEVLALAKKKKGVAIIDEGIARETAEMLGIESHGSFYILFKEVAEGKLSKEDAHKKVDEMIKKGWRIRHEQYLDFLEILESMKQPLSNPHLRLKAW